MTHIQGREGTAAIEHAGHVGDVARVPTAYIQGREGVAVEHASHVGDIARVEVAKVHGGDGRTLVEHLSHSGDTIEF